MSPQDRAAAFAGRTLRVERLPHGVHHLVLARPAVRNAIDGTMAEELAAALAALADLGAPELRLLVLRGDGDFFSAGADIGYMREQAERSGRENLAAAARLAQAFHSLAALPAPVVGVLKGAAMGGGLGLLACCDLVIAEDTAVAALPESRLGVLPAVISPYLLRKIGVSHTAVMAYSGRRFMAEELLRMGLVQRVVAATDLPAALDGIVADVLRGGPEAQRRTKRLLLELEPLPSAAVEATTTGAIAEARASQEARSGFEAFLARRDPAWVPKDPSPEDPGPR